MNMPAFLLLAATGGLPLSAEASAASSRPASRPAINYDESKVPAYTLPDPLKFQDGRPVEDAAGWRRRRQEILELFRTHVYGRAPDAPQGMRFERFDENPAALGGLALRRQVTVRLAPQADEPGMDLLLYLPAERHGPVPVFAMLNFRGNQEVHPDPGIRITGRWVLNAPESGITDNRAGPQARGADASRYPVELILRRGYGLVTVCCADLDPDFDDGFANGVHGALDPPGKPRPPDAWGTIAAWAWGLSRVMDYLQTDPDVDARRVVVLGHSRMGKTALWAAAQDERFAIAISNNSGCGGAALSRRAYGETVESINGMFPHWFCANFRRYNGREAELPVDQHMLIALIGPRPVYVASAEEDRWADPRGEFLAAKAADPVYRLLGTDGLPAGDMPPVGQPVAGTIGYHCRPGAHDLTEYDWRQYLAFADRHLAGARPDSGGADRR